jgi:hypothetical protein
MYKAKEHPLIFCLWQALMDDGGIIAVSTYEKYNGGLSPQDALALARVLAALSRHRPRYSIEARSFLSFQPDDWDNHLILVGGLLSNQVTRAMTQQSSLRNLQSSFILRREMLRDTCRRLGKDCLTPTYIPGLETNVAGVKVDYGLITVQSNPLNSNKQLYVLAGIKGWGTLAAATVFSSEEYYRPLNDLFKEHFGLLPEKVNRDSLIEIVVRTEVGSTGTGGVLGLKDISVELIRVDGEVNTQFVRPDSCLEWRAKSPAASRLQRESRACHLSLNLNERVATIELRGAAFAARFDESRLTASELDRFDWDIASAAQSPDWRLGAENIAERFQKELPDKFGDLLHLMETTNSQPEHSWVRFVTPRDCLRAPFEFLRIEQDYLVLQYPVFRAISGAFNVKAGLSSEFIERLELSDEPLRVLLVASDPLGNIVKDVNQEVESIGQIYSDMQQALKVEIDLNILRAEGVTATWLKEALWKCPYHIFHFAGHSSWNQANPEQSGLCMKDDKGAKIMISADQLKAWAEDSELLFCFLSSCEGTQSAGERHLLGRDFLGLADALVQAGVPEVLGFRWQVTSKSALRFAQRFYRGLLGEARFNTETATFLARCQIAEQNRDDQTWLSPILIAQK